MAGIPNGGPAGNGLGHKNSAESGPCPHTNYLINRNTVNRIISSEQPTEHPEANKIHELPATKFAFFLTQLFCFSPTQRAIFILSCVSWLKKNKVSEKTAQAFKNFIRLKGWKKLAQKAKQIHGKMSEEEKAEWLITLDGVSMDLLNEESTSYTLATPDIRNPQTRRIFTDYIYLIFLLLLVEKHIHKSHRK